MRRLLSILYIGLAGAYALAAPNAGGVGPTGLLPSLSWRPSARQGADTSVVFELRNMSNNPRDAAKDVIVGAAILDGQEFVDNIDIHPSQLGDMPAEDIRSIRLTIHTNDRWAQARKKSRVKVELRVIHEANRPEKTQRTAARYRLKKGRPGIDVRLFELDGVDLDVMDSDMDAREFAETAPMDAVPDPGNLDAGAAQIGRSVEAGRRWYVNDGAKEGDSYTHAPGDDTAGDGTRERPFLTIRRALAAAQCGETIFIDAGLYPEDVFIDKDTIALVGADRFATTILPAGMNGIYANNCAGLLIKNFRLDRAFNSIMGFGVKNSRVDGITVKQSGYGIYLYDCSNIVLKNIFAAISSGNAGSDITLLPDTTVTDIPGADTPAQSLAPTESPNPVVTMESASSTEVIAVTPAVSETPTTVVLSGETAGTTVMAAADSLFILIYGIPPVIYAVPGTPVTVSGYALFSTGAPVVTTDQNQAGASLYIAGIRTFIYSALSSNGSFSFSAILARAADGSFGFQPILAPSVTSDYRVYVVDLHGHGTQLQSYVRFKIIPIGDTAAATAQTTEISPTVVPSTTLLTSDGTSSTAVSTSNETSTFIASTEIILSVPSLATDSAVVVDASAGETVVSSDQEPVPSLPSDPNMSMESQPIPVVSDAPVASDSAAARTVAVNDTSVVFLPIPGGETKETETANGGDMIVHAEADAADRPDAPAVVDASETKLPEPKRLLHEWTLPDIAATGKEKGSKLGAICHRPPGNPGKSHTIYVSPHAVKSHLSHGDLPGQCPDGDAATSPSKGRVAAGKTRIERSRVAEGKERWTLKFELKHEGIRPSLTTLSKKLPPAMDGQAPSASTVWPTGTLRIREAMLPGGWIELIDRPDGRYLEIRDVPLEPTETADLEIVLDMDMPALSDGRQEETEEVWTEVAWDIQEIPSEGLPERERLVKGKISGMDPGATVTIFDVTRVPPQKIVIVEPDSSGGFEFAAIPDDIREIVIRIENPNSIPEFRRVKLGEEKTMHLLGLIEPEKISAEDDADAVRGRVDKPEDRQEFVKGEGEKRSRIDIPARAMARKFYVVMREPQNMAEIEAAAKARGERLLSATEVVLIDEETGEEIHTGFKKRIRIAFSLAKLQSRESAKISHYDPLNKKLDDVSSAVDPEKFEVAADVEHFSIYASLGVPAAATATAAATYADFSKLLVYPNPYESRYGTNRVVFENVPASARLTIYTVGGQIIQEITNDGAGDINGSTRGGSTDAHIGWGLTNRQGRNVAGNIYLFVLQDAAGDVKTGRIAVVR